MNKKVFNYQETVSTISTDKLHINDINFQFTDKDIFDYFEKTNERLYNINFQFGQGNLEWHRDKYGINTSYYVFTTDKSVNAFAAQINGWGLVGINMGLMHFLTTNFNDNDNADVVHLPKMTQCGQIDFISKINWICILNNLDLELN